MPASDQNQTTITHATIKIDGAFLPPAKMDQLIEIVVESSLYLPDMLVMTFTDDKLELVDDALFKLGGVIEIEASDNTNVNQTKPLFKGEITAIEPDYMPGNLMNLTIRGYTKGHRMHRESKTKAWINITDSDLASQIAGSYGLSVEVDSTTETFDHIYQYGQTDMEFLRQRADRIGYQVFVQDDKLYFKKPDSQSTTLNLEWGTSLQSFRPRLTIADQVNEVTVKGWDIKNKEAIVGIATSSSSSPKIGLGKWGGETAMSALTSAKKLQVRQPVHSQDDANKMAASILDEINGSFIEAEGEAIGSPSLRAGMITELVKLGTKFSGKYKVTTVRHVYGTGGSLKSFFTVEGHRPRTFAYLLGDTIAPQSQWGGVVTAIVTNNNIANDGQNGSMDYGMVKVKYPWMDDSQESFWARLIIPGGGSNRGIYFMPEVNDEVLVAFEHGDFNRPVVIGGVFNGKDSPPEAIGTVVKSGAVKTRIIKTRTGHTIRFADQDSGEEYIEIVDAKSNTRIFMDTQNKKIEMTSKGDIEIKADGNMKLEAKGGIDIAATRGLTAKGQTVDVSAQSSGSFKASGKLELQGATLSAQGSGTAEVKGGGMLTLQGAMVKIN